MKAFVKILYLASILFISAAAYIFFSLSPENSQESFVLFKVKQQSYTVAKMAVKADNIYLAFADAKVSKLSLNADILAENKESKPSYPTAILVEADKLFVAYENAKVIAYETSNLNKLWEFSAEDKIGVKFSTYKNYILFTSFDKHIYMLEKISGKLFAKIKTKDAVNGGVVVNSDIAVYGDCSGELAAVDLLSREKIWTKEIGSHIPLSPIICGDKIFVANHAGSLKAFNLKGFDELKSFAKVEISAHTQMLSDDSKIIFVDADKKLQTLNTITGKAEEILPFAGRDCEILQDENFLLILNLDGKIDVLGKPDYKKIFTHDFNLKLDVAASDNGVIAAVDLTNKLYIFKKNESTD